jgi:hypothetical protein
VARLDVQIAAHRRHLLGARVRVAERRGEPRVRLAVRLERALQLPRAPQRAAELRERA